MRLIDAEALIQKRNHAKAYAQDMYVIGQGYVMDAPTIAAVPVVRGEWIEDGDMQICSNCGEEHSWEEYRASYCEDCGAKMESEGGT